MRQGAVLLLVLGLLFAMFACERWKYRECRKVGHSVLYCLDQLGKGGGG